MTNKTFVATFHPSFFHAIEGFVLFEQKDAEKGLHVTFHLSGFPRAKTLYAIHIHEYGDTRDECHSLGGHWNPHGYDHGAWVSILPLLTDQKYKKRSSHHVPHHAGDLINNLYTNTKKEFMFEYDDPLLSSDILGRSVVIHHGQDDLGLGGNKESKINGNAGPRLACAVIGLANPHTSSLT